MCNDNAYGLMGCTMAARELGTTPPCVMQNDYSLINRRIEENGLSEASAPWNEDVGLLAYNTLAGGMLTGKYLGAPAACDDPNKARALGNSVKKRPESAEAAIMNPVSEVTHRPSNTDSNTGTGTDTN